MKIYILPVGLFSRENAIMRDKIKSLKLQTYFFFFFNYCTVHLFVFVKMFVEEKNN